METAARSSWSRRDFLEALLVSSVGLASASAVASAFEMQAGAVRGSRSPGRAIFCVTDSCFGARGDGIADDAPAIQAAIDAASDAGGGAVWLPAGTYLLRSVREQPGVRYFLLDVPSHVTIAGAGVERSLLLAAPGLPDQTRIISTRSTDGASLVMSPTFLDFTLDGNATLQPDARSCVGISCIHTEGARHVRVTVRNVKGTADSEGTGFDSYFASRSSYDRCQALRTGGGPTGSGFSATNSRAISYQDCRASGSTQWQGFTTYHADAIEYLRCHGFRNAQRGLNCEQSSSVSYRSCRAGGPGVGNSGDGFYLYHSSGITLSDCRSSENKSGVTNLGSTGIQLLGGAFEDSIRGID